MLMILVDECITLLAMRASASLSNRPPFDQIISWVLKIAFQSFPTNVAEYLHFYLVIREWIFNSLLMETNCQLLTKMYLLAVHLHPLGHSSNLSFIYRVYSLADDITWSVILAKHHIGWWWHKSILKYRDNIVQSESSNFIFIYNTCVSSQMSSMPDTLF